MSGTQLKFFHTVFSFLLGLFTMVPCGHAQTIDEFPIHQWMKMLSVREDIQTRNFRHIFTILSHADSTEYRQAISFLEQKGPRNVRFQIRLNALKAKLLYSRRKIPGTPRAEEVMEAALQMAYATEDELLIADMFQLMASLQSYVYEIGPAMVYAINAADLQDKIGPEFFYNIAFDRYKLGYLLYHTREYQKAIFETKKALEWHLDTISVGTKHLGLFLTMNAWNTIGLAYTKMGEYDSAFIALNKSLDLTDDYGQAYWRGLVQGNIGDIFFLMHQYDTAMTLLMNDYRLSMQAREYDNASNSLQWVARIHAFEKKTELALQEAHESLQLLNRNKNPNFLVNIYYTFVEVYNALGNADSSYLYFQKFLTLHDSLELNAAKSQSEIARVMQTNTANIQRIQRLTDAKHKMELIRNFSIALALLLGAFGFLYLNRQRLKMQLRQKEVMERQQAAEAEAAHAKAQLTAFTKSLLEKTQMLEKLTEELKFKENSDKHVQLIGELSQHAILTDTDWTEFKSLFDQVYPGFFMALKSKAHDITPAEMRIAALIRLELSSSEAASLLGISSQSARKTRQRLKVRLQLERDDDVNKFLAAL